MNNVKYYILPFITLILCCMSCDKENGALTNSLFSNVVILEDDSVSHAISATAGNGIALLVYVDELNEYNFKMVSNQGNVLWTKQFDLSTFETFAVGLPITVLPRPGNDFDIFYGKSRMRINSTGDVLGLDTLFLADLVPPPVGGLTYGISINKILFGVDDSYLVMGNYNLSGNRAFISEVSQTGQVKFQKFFAINVNGINQFTGGLPLDSGGYFLAGACTASKNTMFTQVRDADGNELRTTQNEIDNFTFNGGELMQTADGNYAYLISPVDGNSIDRRSRIFAINDTGAILGVRYLDLAAINISQGLVQTLDGSFTGLVKDKDEFNNVSGSFTKPQFCYYYSLNSYGELLYQKYLNTTYSSDYNSITPLSDGRILIFGTSYSLGEDLKLCLMYK